MDQWVEVISLEPRASIYHNFLSKEECEHLINLAKPYLQRSTVGQIGTTTRYVSGSRTSSGAYLSGGLDNIVEGIERRIAEWTSTHVDNGGAVYAFHYQVGQKFDPHSDYGTGPNNRIATVLMYLSDVEEGGETVFPMAKGNHGGLPSWNKLYKYGDKGLSVKPKMGDALLFWNAKPDGSFDPLSMHGACPVIRGVKWCCTKLIHANTFPSRPLEGEGVGLSMDMDMDIDIDLKSPSRTFFGPSERDKMMGGLIHANYTFPSPLEGLTGEGEGLSMDMDIDRKSPPRTFFGRPVEGVKKRDSLEKDPRTRSPFYSLERLVFN